jgi:DNA-directed RNA polymerase subunit RPC12/RpoP
VAERRRGDVRRLYRCDKCNAEVDSFANMRGDDCPYCSGHFKPVHPLAQELVELGRAICDINGCEDKAIVIYRVDGQTRVRCIEHQYESHITWTDEAIRREMKEIWKELDKELYADAEMSKYDSED